MELGIRGRKALVLGGSRGLGRGVALALAKEGANVGIIARSEKELTAVHAEIGGSEGGHGYVAADLTHPDALLPAIECLEKSVGEFDIVVHAIGGPTQTRDPLSSYEKWEESIHLNAGIAISANARLIPGMQKRAWGRVVHISSISASHLLGDSLYAASKAFLRSYSKTLGRAVAVDNVVVSCVLPGAFAFDGSNWDRIAKTDPEKYRAFVEQHLARKVIGSVDEIVPLVLVLASEHAAFAAAAELNIDGGTY